MVNDTHLRLVASDRSYFALVKKEINTLAATGGFSAKRLAEIDIVVAEMLSNLHKHAGGGELLVKLIETKDVQGIEILCMDSGPGITDLKSMMKDGESTTQTLGQGLGAMDRLSDFFQIHTQKGWGTILLSRICNTPLPFTQVVRKIPLDSAEVRSLVVAKSGEKECGDRFCCIQTPQQIKLFLGDGLGHGHEAAVAVEMAIEAFKSCPEESPQKILRFMHQAVRKTRGLVGSIACFNIKEKKWQFCGIGNIGVRILGATINKTLISYNGIIGMNIPNTLNDHWMDYELGQLLILHSDGIKSRWDLQKFTGLMRYDLSVLNATLYKEFTRNNDDTSVVSCKVSF